MMIAQRFAVDKMLGRLATWLRLLGQDTIYGSHLGGGTLIRRARNEGRTILTRDHRALRAARELPLVFIVSNDFREQLRQVIDACRFDPFAQLFSRCTRCNTPVSAVPKADVAERVPPYVFETQQRFACCSRCGRVYWAGTHDARVREQLRALGYTEPSATVPGGD